MGTRPESGNNDNDTRDFALARSSAPPLEMMLTWNLELLCATIIYIYYQVTLEWTISWYEDMGSACMVLPPPPVVAL